MEQNGFVDRLIRLKEIGRTYRFSFTNGIVVDGKFSIVRGDYIIIEQWTSPTTLKVDYIPINNIVSVTEIIEVRKKGG